MKGTGAVSWLNYAFRLMYLPIGLFGVSIGTAALPDIAHHAAMEDVEGMRRTVSSALRLMLMLNVPATVGLVRAGASDRVAAARARTFRTGGHGRNRGRADVLRARADRLLGSEDRIAKFLFACATAARR